MSIVERKFYHLFWNDDTCQNIFLKPKTELLENEVELVVKKEHAYPPRLVLSNSLKQKKLGDAVIQRSEYQHIEVWHNLQTSAKKFFSEDVVKSYFEKRFGKAIAKFNEDVSGGTHILKEIVSLVSSLKNEQSFLKYLSKYEIVPKGINSVEELLKYYEKMIKEDVKKYLTNQNLIEIVITLDLVSAYYNQKVKDNLMAATTHYTDVIYNNENFGSRVALFDKLFEIGVLSGKEYKSYYECVNCEPDTFNGVITINVKPSKLLIKCPNCSKEVFYAVPYKIHPDIYTHIIHSDGLLFFAIKHLLDDTKTNHRADEKYLHDVQIDFTIYDEVGFPAEAYEVKMFKTDRPTDTTIKNLKETVGQVKKIKEKMSAINPEWKNLPYLIISNINNEDIIFQATQETKTDSEEYNISIISPKTLYKKLKSK